MQDNQPKAATPPRRCPVCGVAMIAEKSDPRLKSNDRHVCLNCGTVIAIERPRDEAAE